jgi:hypothetical protein
MRTPAMGHERVDRIDIERHAAVLDRGHCQLLQ